MLLQKLEGYTQGAPAPKHISDATSDKLLVGSFLGDDVEDSDANNYLELAQKTKRETTGSKSLPAFVPRFI